METSRTAAACKRDSLSVKSQAKSFRKLSQWIPIPLLWPSILLFFLLFSISQAQTTTLLFHEDFNWSDNAWNSSKRAESPRPEQSFDGAVYKSRRCLKLASSTSTGSIHWQIPEDRLLHGNITLILRGARYDKGKASLLLCKIIRMEDTLLTDTLRFVSYYKDGDSEPYRQYDSMTQGGNGFASSDTLSWECPEGSNLADFRFEIQAAENGQCFLDQYSLYLSSSGSQPVLNANPPCLALEGPAGERVSDTLFFSGRNLDTDIRLQAQGPDQALAAYPIILRSDSLENGPVPVIVSVQTDSIPKKYTILGLHGKDRFPLAEIPILVQNESFPDTSMAECTAPIRPEVTENRPDFIRLEWESDASQFRVRIGNLFAIAYEGCVDAPFFESNSLEAGSFYWWDVAAICSPGDTSSLAQGPAFQIPASTGQRRHDGNKLMQAFVSPNPSNGNLKLYLPFACRVRILDAQGKCVFSRDLPQGITAFSLARKGFFTLHYGNHPASEQILKFIIL